MGAEEERQEQDRRGERGEGKREGAARGEGGKKEKDRKEVFLWVSVHFLSGDITT